ncbi:hypothetical protein HDC90_005062, partial [Pedobacter sp. AK013]|nr:hypothetical protein [Pedobacter sp. AK013]
NITLQRVDLKLPFFINKKIFLRTTVNLFQHLSATKILKQVQDDDLIYFAKATERVSLITVTLICPG